MPAGESELVTDVLRLLALFGLVVGSSASVVEPQGMVPPATIPVLINRLAGQDLAAPLCWSCSVTSPYRLAEECDEPDQFSPAVLQ